MFLFLLGVTVAVNALAGVLAGFLSAGKRGLGHDLAVLLIPSLACAGLNYLLESAVAFWKVPAEDGVSLLVGVTAFIVTWMITANVQAKKNRPSGGG